MADGVFNVAKGRVNELQDRVANNDPGDAALVLLILSEDEGDDGLEDRLNLAEVLANPANIESRFDNYQRLILFDADVSPSQVDLVNNLRFSDITDPFFPSAGGAGNDEQTSKLLICVDFNSTSGTDTDITPLTHHDFVIQTNGSDIVGAVSSGGYFSAS